MGDTKDMAKMMDRELKEGKAPTLTLNPDDVKYDMSFMEEPSLKDKDLVESEETSALQVQWMNPCFLRMKKAGGSICKTN